MLVGSAGEFIARRPAPDDVGDEEVLPAEGESGERVGGSGDEPIKGLSCPSNEGLSGDLFILSKRFPNEANSVQGPSDISAKALAFAVEDASFTRFWFLNQLSPSPSSVRQCERFPTCTYLGHIDKLCRCCYPSYI